MTRPESRGCPNSSSWPDLFRPSTPLSAGIKDVDARDERGHDDAINSVQQKHPPPARPWAAPLFHYCLFFAVFCGAVFCGAGRMSPQGSLTTFFSGILSIAAL
jgi:hypothetical protein